MAVIVGRSERTSVEGIWSKICCFCFKHSCPDAVATLYWSNLVYEGLGQNFFSQKVHKVNQNFFVAMHLCWKYTFGALCSSQVVRRGRRWATEASCARRTPNTELVTCGRHPLLLSLCNLQYCTSPADFHWFSVSNHPMSRQVISHQTRPYQNLEKKAKSESSFVLLSLTILTS